MRRIRSHLKTHKKRPALIAVAICLLILILLNVIGYFFDCSYISVFAAVAQVGDSDTQSRLLMEAMEVVGVFSPEEAANVWATGLIRRSAAMQYAVMTSALKQAYARTLEDTAPNWVTGVSSPFVESFYIIGKESPSADEMIIDILFSTATSTGPAGSYLARLYLVREGEFWRIAQVITDNGLCPYTGFRPTF